MSCQVPNLRKKSDEAEKRYEAGQMEEACMKKSVGRVRTKNTKRMSLIEGQGFLLLTIDLALLWISIVCLRLRPRFTVSLHTYVKLDIYLQIEASEDLN